MKYQQLATLVTRESTIGHWPFRSDLADLSAGAHTLSGSAIASRFVEGQSEPGVTAYQLLGDDAGGTAPGIKLAAANATAFDLGTDDFSIEVIAATTEDGTQAFVKKLGSNTGFWFGVSLGWLSFEIGDGTHDVSATEDLLTITDGLFHHFVATVKRSGTPVVRLYVDGVETPGSPFDISAVTGSISAPSVDLRLGHNITGIMDEVCISREILTAASVAERASGRRLEVDDFDSDYCLHLLPRSNHTNDVLQRLLSAFSQAHYELRQAASDFNFFGCYDRVPAQYLTDMAALYDFELIGEGYATEAERRKFIAWILWIYQRKGTRVAAEKLISLLGFTVGWSETFPDGVPFFINFHYIYGPERVLQTSFSDPFLGASNWLPPIDYHSSWKVINGKLHAIASGSDDWKSAVLIPNTLTSYRMEVKYQIMGGQTSTDRLGFFLKYVDDNNWIALTLNIATVSTLKIERKVSNTLTSTTVCDLSVALPDGGFDSGVHALWVFADHVNGKYSGGIDEATLFYQTSISIGAMAATYKGLLINKTLTVDFDDLLIQSLNLSQSARLWTDGFTQRKVTIALSGSPAFAASKQEYLKIVLPHYVPAGVTVEIT